MLFTKTLRGKLLMAGTLLTTTPILIISISALWQNRLSERVATSESMKLAYADLDHIVAGVHGMVLSQQEVLQQKINADLNVATDQLQAAGGAKLTDGKVAWQARNQITGASQPVELPQMVIQDHPVKFDDNPQNQTPVVDKVKELTGATCTIFQRMNDNGDMLRVLTSVMTLDGKRAVGTFIPAAGADGARNTVIQAVLDGKRFVGRAFVVNA